VRRFWSGWQQALIIVSPETVVRWHKSGFTLYWQAISRDRRIVGRKRISKEVRDLIFRMVAENPTWGSPRIHGELLTLGFDVSERTISRWMRRAPRDCEPAKLWLAFLQNHREAIAAMDLFTVPTITFRVLYCFFIISHRRREILHFNVTCHPSSLDHSTVAGSCRLHIGSFPAFRDVRGNHIFAATFGSDGYSKARTKLGKSGK